MLEIKPLTIAEFSPFGEILQAEGQPTVMINQDNCARYSDLAKLDFADGQAGISIFHAKPYMLPLTLKMLERHPLGSQAFLPMSDDPFLVIVAKDYDGKPGTPNVFLSSGKQGVNYHRNTWHGVLTPISGSGLFAVVDRIGGGNNLQEHWLDEPYTITFQ